jgi:hypothetical protein
MLLVMEKQKEEKEKVCRFSIHGPSVYRVKHTRACNRETSNFFLKKEGTD